MIGYDDDMPSTQGDGAHHDNDNNNDKVIAMTITSNEDAICYQKMRYLTSVV